MANNMSSRQACHAARYVVARVLRGLFWCLKYTVILPLATMALMALFVLWKDNTTPGKLLVKEINFVRQTAPAGQFPVSECWFSSSDSSGKQDVANDEEVSGSSHTCTISISCATILNNMSDLKSGKEEFVPSDGWILAASEVEFTEGESVHDVLQRVCKDAGIQMESSFTPAYNSAYVEGINNLYEFDCGQLSGWMYNVNGWFPNYGCSKYTVQDGDVINWVYTCNLGKDVGDNSMY